jgi:hypothetical protein
VPSAVHFKEHLAPVHVPAPFGPRYAWVVSNRTADAPRHTGATTSPTHQLGATTRASTRPFPSTAPNGAATPAPASAAARTKPRHLKQIRPPPPLPAIIPSRTTPLQPTALPSLRTRHEIRVIWLDPNLSGVKAKHPIRNCCDGEIVRNNYLDGYR